MRVMASDATELASAFEKTFAQTHRKIMLEQIIFGSGSSIKGDDENAERVFQILAGTKVTVAFPLFQDTRIAGLVA